MLVDRDSEYGDFNDCVASSYLELAEPLLRLEVPHLSKPNARQQYAVEHAMKHSFSLIQGPPGTGKTVTAVRLAYHFVKLNQKLPQGQDSVKPQVMICGPSNKSVDVIGGQYFYGLVGCTSLCSALWSLLDRPFCERDLMFCACFFFFICLLTFADVHQPTFSKLFLHDVASAPKEALLCQFSESAS